MLMEVDQMSFSERWAAWRKRAILRAALSTGLVVRVENGEVLEIGALQDGTTSGFDPVSYVLGQRRGCGEGEPAPLMPDGYARGPDGETGQEAAPVPVRAQYSAQDLYRPVALYWNAQERRFRLGAELLEGLLETLAEDGVILAYLVIGESLPPIPCLLDLDEQDRLNLSGGCTDCFPVDTIIERDGGVTAKGKDLGQLMGELDYLCMFLHL